MSQEQRFQTIKLKVVEATIYWREALEDEALLLYARELEDLEPMEVVRAFDALKRNPKQIRLPLPSQVRETANPTFDDQAQARIIASKIIQELGDAGPNRSALARERIGEAGWQVVLMFGGWLRVCEEINFENLGTFRAQMRDAAQAVLQASRAGKLHSPIGLPRPERHLDDRALQSTGDILQKALQHGNHGKTRIGFPSPDTKSGPGSEHRHGDEGHGLGPAPWDSDASDSDRTESQGSLRGATDADAASEDAHDQDERIRGPSDRT